MKKRIGTVLVLAALAVAVAIPKHKTHADVALTVNPTLYDCIKDNGVVSRTLTFDPQNKNNQCDMIVSTGASQTVQWIQAPQLAYSGSILNWSPADQTQTEVAASGLNQVPADLIQGSSGSSGQDNAVQTLFTTLKNPASITRLSVNVTPAPPSGYSIQFFVNDLQESGGGDVCTITGPSSSCLAIAKPPLFYNANDEVYLQMQVACNSTVPCPYTFQTVSWTIQ